MRQHVCTMMSNNIDLAGEVAVLKASALMADKSPAADAVMTVTGMMTSGATQSELEEYLSTLPPDLRDAVAAVTCRVFADILGQAPPEFAFEGTKLQEETQDLGVMFWERKPVEYVQATAPIDPGDDKAVGALEDEEPPADVIQDNEPVDPVRVRFLERLRRLKPAWR